MKTYKIAVMGGDGTGPEVTVEAVKVMDAAAAKFGFKTEQTEFDFGGERYKRTGEILPDGEYHTKDTGTAQVIVAKNRDGSTGVIDLAFIPDITSFRNTFNNQIQVDELPF
jgi:isocitrate/isopropylmalate dehydrogenase